MTGSGSILQYAIVFMKWRFLSLRQRSAVTGPGVGIAGPFRGISRYAHPLAAITMRERKQWNP